MTRNEAASDTLVIGGGVVGAALAWGLARAGERVTVLDDGDIVLRASRGNFGLVWVQSKGAKMFDYARWTRRSADLWPEFAATIGAETGLDLAYEKPGGIHFMLSETELEAARARNFAMKDVTGPDDYGAEIVDRLAPALVRAIDVAERAGGEAAGRFGRLEPHQDADRLVARSAAMDSTRDAET